MRRKNTLLGVGLLLAVIGLGIGYALDTITLKVNGTATVKEGSSFNVYFSNATQDATQVTDEKESTAEVTSDTKVAEMTATLTNVGDSQTATFEITNASQEGMAAKISKDNVLICSTADCTTSDFASDYFNVTTSIANDITIPAGDDNTANITVTVSLKKAFVGTTDVTSKTENFYVVLKDVEAVSE